MSDRTWAEQILRDGYRADVQSCARGVLDAILDGRLTGHLWERLNETIEDHPRVTSQPIQTLWLAQFPSIGVIDLGIEVFVVDDSQLDWGRLAFFAFCEEVRTESDEPTAILMRRIVDAFAEYERLIVGARTKAALRAKRAQGLCALGFKLLDDGQTLAAEALEQRILARIRECRRSGLSLCRTAQALNQAGLRTRSGAEWRHEYVANLLRAEPRVM